MLLILNDKDPGMQFLLVAKLVTSALTDLEHLCALRCVLNQYSGLNQFISVILANIVSVC